MQGGAACGVLRAFSKDGRSHSLRHSHEPGQELCNTDGTPRERPLVLASSINKSVYSKHPWHFYTVCALCEKFESSIPRAFDI